VSSSPSPYRIGDGAPVSFEAAQALWTSMARDVLVDVARHYNRTITYSRLAAEVQTRSGVQTKMLMSQWIGDVLGVVSDECAARGEPLLPALCLHEDGSVGDGYADAVERATSERPRDADLHAAEQRLECYRHYGAELPPDGGRPTLMRKVAPPRAVRTKTTTRTTTPRRTERPIAICPTCFTQLPASGRCDTCA
jgi:hypothetical protein